MDKHSFSSINSALEGSTIWRLRPVKEDEPEMGFSALVPFNVDAHTLCDVMETAAMAGYEVTKMHNATSVMLTFLPIGEMHQSFYTLLVTKHGKDADAQVMECINRTAPRIAMIGSNIVGVWTNRADMLSAIAEMIYNDLLRSTMEFRDLIWHADTIS